MSFFIQKALFYITKINQEVDATVATVNTSFFNDGIHDTVFNVVMETFVDIYGLTINFVLKLPETSSDTKYGREFLRTSVSIDKFLNGNRGNYLVALLLDQVMKYIDFEIKFPLPKVSILFFVQ